MYAAVFEIESWLGPQEYMFKGESASDIVNEFERIQDLGCVLTMGRQHENNKGQKELDKLADFLAKHQQDELTIKDLEAFEIKTSIGTMRCAGVAGDEESFQALLAAHPLVRQR